MFSRLCGSITSGFIALVTLTGTPDRADAAPDVETRDFAVLVDGRPAGDVHMTFNKQEDGSTIFTCDTDIRVTVKVALFTKTYTYSYRGREVWKGGRLIRFDSNANDDGKRLAVSASAESDKLRVRVNGDDRTMPGNTWLSSYWSMPDNGRINQTVPIMDADTGADISAQLRFLGVEERNVDGNQHKVNHFRLLGKTQVDLWFDTAGRLVSQEWVEDGHRTRLELNRLRR